MTNDGHDETRKLLVAYLDVATWCEDLARIGREFMVSVENGEEPTRVQIERQIAAIDKTVSYLEASRKDVERLRARLGLSTDATGQ